VVKIPKEVIFVAGDRSEALYIIISGMLHAACAGARRQACII
jgi:hypothetical protein